VPSVFDDWTRHEWTGDRRGATTRRAGADVHSLERDDMSTADGARAILRLYRSIVRAHARLPEPMRALGSSYARDEFRRHIDADTTTAAQWTEFASQWRKYVRAIAPPAASSSSDAGGAHVEMDGVYPRGVDAGGELSEDAIEAMTDEQRAKLAELRREAMAFGAGAFAPRGGEDGGEGERPP
jgi:hypothetical protein